MFSCWCSLLMSSSTACAFWCVTSVGHFCCGCARALICRRLVTVGCSEVWRRVNFCNIDGCLQHLLRSIGRLPFVSAGRPRLRSGGNFRYFLGRIFRRCVSVGGQGRGGATGCGSGGGLLLEDDRGLPLLLAPRLLQLLPDVQKVAQAVEQRRR